MLDPSETFTCIQYKAVLRLSQNQNVLPLRAQITRLKAENKRLLKENARLKVGYHAACSNNEEWKSYRRNHEKQHFELEEYVDELENHADELERR